MRVAWGCDRDAEAVLYRITCPDCNGGSETCERCNGRGEAPVWRCPASHIDANLAAAFDCHARLSEGVLPASGGWLDQTASFVQFAGVVDGEHGAIQREQRSAQERKAKSHLSNVKRTGR